MIFLSSESTGAVTFADLLQRTGQKITPVFSSVTYCSGQ